ncbi:hypothetical protein AgCh_018535 [Apium graveolens]
MPYKSNYILKYIDQSEYAVDMPIGGAKIEMSLGTKGTGGWKKVVEACGEDILQANGEVIFQGVLKLWLKGYKVIILDIPLLFEVKMDKWTSPTIVVWVDPETQLTRLMERDGTLMEDAKNRIDAQMPLDLKKAKADIVIDNTGSFEELNEKFYKGNGLLQKLKFIVARKRNCKTDQYQRISTLTGKQVLSSDLRLHLEKEERAKLKETEEPEAPAYSDEEPELMEKETMFALQEMGEQYYDDENDVEYE